MESDQFKYDPNELARDLEKAPESVRRYVAFLIDCLSRVTAERDQERHDFLTGLPNRRLFLKRYNQLEAQVMSDGGLSFLVLIQFDVKGLHDINAGFGQNQGDQVIVKASQVPDALAAILGGLRENDAACRMGGDEFAAAFVVKYENLTGSQDDLLTSILERFDLIAQDIASRSEVSDPPFLLHRDATIVTFEDLASDPPVNFERAYEKVSLKDKKSGRQNNDPNS